MKSWLKGWLDPVSGAIALILVLVILEKFEVVGHSLVTVVVVLATLIFVFDMNHKYRKDRREGPYSKIARLEDEMKLMLGYGHASLVPLNQAVNEIERWLQQQPLDTMPRPSQVTIELKLDERTSWLLIDVKRRPPFFVEEGQENEIQFAIWKNTWAVHRCIDGEVQDPALFYMTKTPED